MRPTSIEGTVPVADIADMVELHNHSVAVATECINRLIVSHNKLNRKMFLLSLATIGIFAGIGYLNERLNKLEKTIYVSDNTPLEGEANNE